MVGKALEGGLLCSGKRPGTCGRPSPATPLLHFFPGGGERTEHTGIISPFCWLLAFPERLS